MLDDGTAEQTLAMAAAGKTKTKKSQSLQHYGHPASRTAGRLRRPEQTTPARSALRTICGVVIERGRHCQQMNVNARGKKENVEKFLLVFPKASLAVLVARAKPTAVHFTWYTSVLAHIAASATNKVRPNRKCCRWPWEENPQRRETLGAQRS